MISIQSIYEQFAPKTRCFGCIYKHIKKNTIYSFAGIDEKKNKFVLHNNKTGYVEYFSSLDKLSMLGLPLYYGDFMMLIEIKVHSILKRCQDNNIEPQSDAEFIYLMQNGRSITELWRNKDLPLEMSCDNEGELQAMLSAIDNLREMVMMQQEKQTMLQDLVLDDTINE